MILFARTRAGIIRPGVALALDFAARIGVFDWDVHGDRIYVSPEVETWLGLRRGTLCGPAYGALSAASMLPLTFADKRSALLGAFLNRFAIGFVIGAARLPVPA